ncbi:hypothetical protein [Streptomyces cucumeris]|uniref:hypothetical protein n=1 Tax=Streptomyces cucumeris TaxID=2962890 RepID=UPI003D735982
MAFNYRKDRLEAFKSDVEAASDEITSILDDFLGSLTNWYGFTDDFAEDVGPDWQESVSDIQGMLGSVSEALYGIVGGRTQEQQQVAKTQSGIMDDIHAGQAATDQGFDGGSST